MLYPPPRKTRGQSSTGVKITSTLPPPPQTTNYPYLALREIEHMDTAVGASCGQHQRVLPILSKVVVPRTAAIIAVAPANASPARAATAPARATPPVMLATLGKPDAYARRAVMQPSEESTPFFVFKMYKF